MPAEKRIVIAGASLAGATAAQTLREEGFDGSVTLIGDEPEHPYERPPLSKEYLRGEAAEKPYVHPAGYYEANAIELLTSTRVAAIEPADHEVVLEDDRRLGYDALLLATGARPRRFEVPGAELGGVHYLRTVADSERIGDRLGPGRRLVVIGSGWIGSEIAASARERGCEVTTIAAGSVPLERVLGPEVGAIYLDIHRDHGIEFLPETTVERFEGEGSVARVLTRDRAVLEADLVVVGIGVTPRTELAEVAGLRVDNGVSVDERLETSAPDVFAAGDVANAHHPFYGRRIRVEHWANARAQGAVAARAMLGQPVSYEEIPYFFSDQYEIGMEYGGHATGWDQVVFRGDLEAREFVAFWLDRGRVVAGMNVNVWDVNDAIRELVRSRRVVDPAALADSGTPIDDLDAVAAR